MKPASQRWLCGHGNMYPAQLPANLISKPNMMDEAEHKGDTRYHQFKPWVDTGEAEMHMLCGRSSAHFSALQGKVSWPNSVGLIIYHTKVGI